MDRMDKLIADRLCVSRREAGVLLRKGAVLVNGRQVKGADYRCRPEDQVEVGGQRLELSPKAYIMLNKPAGVISATTDRHCRTVLDILPAGLRRKGLFPAGRLDKDTLGLVLITDDGDFAHRLTAPKNKIPKIYHVRLDAPIQLEEVASAFGLGIGLGGGDQASPARLHALEEGETPLLELTIYEGIYHQVKRMFDRFRREVVYLKRVKIGGLPLDASLEPGDAKALTPAQAWAVFGDTDGAD